MRLASAKRPISRSASPAVCHETRAALVKMADALYEQAAWMEEDSGPADRAEPLKKATLRCNYRPSTRPTSTLDTLKSPMHEQFAGTDPHGGPKGELDYLPKVGPTP